MTVLGLGVAISLLGDSTLYTVLPRPEVAAEAGVSLAMVGVLLGANRAVRLLTNGVAGVLYDRLPRRPLLTASLFLGALSTLIFAAGRGPAPLLLSRLLWGIAWSGIWVGGNAALLAVSGHDNRGRLSGRFQMWFFIGSGAAALFGGVLTDLLGFRQGLLIGGGLTALAALVWLVALPDLRAQDAVRLTPPAAGPVGAPAAAPTAASAAVAAAAFPWATVFAAAVPMFVMRFVYSGVLAATAILWMAGLVGEGVTLGAFIAPIATVTGAFVAVRALISVAGARLAGHLSDLAGRRWWTVAGMLLAGAMGVWLAGSASTPLALSGALLAAVTAGGVQALAPAIVGDRGRAAQHGRMLSVVYTLGDLGSALGPPLALWLLGWLPIATLYRLSAVLLALAVAFAWRMAAKETGHSKVGDWQL